MRFKLNLKRHCIETELKRQYNKLLSSYFKDPSPEIESKIKILVYLLEKLNFSHLRSKFPELNGGLDHIVYLDVEGDSLIITTPHKKIELSV